MIRSVIVVGGSHAGLFTGIALQRTGVEVRIYERAPEMLRGTGAGIRVQPLLADMLMREAGIDLAPATTRTRFDRHLAPRRDSSDNRIVFEQREDGQFASWGSVYRALIAAFGCRNYHCGETCIDSTERNGQVEVRFASGRVDAADLVVFADGIASPARQRLASRARLSYVGYVCWRGLVTETSLSGATRALQNDARLFVVPGLSHVITYLVPGETDGNSEGQRRINAMWYRNVAEGAALDDLMTDSGGIHRPTTLKAGTVQPKHLDAFRRDVANELPPAVAEVFGLAEPWVTPIYDVEPTRMVFGRQILIGDAAAATRPHVSASTARAMRAASGLAATVHAVRSSHDLTPALAAWEREHLAIAWDFTRRGRMIGRRLQVEGTFVPGDPELSQITMPVTARDHPG